MVQSDLAHVLLQDLKDSQVEADFEFVNDYIKWADDFKITKGDTGAVVYAVGNPVDMPFVTFMKMLDEVEPEVWYTMDMMMPSLLARINEFKDRLRNTYENQVSTGNSSDSISLDTLKQVLDDLECSRQMGVDSMQERIDDFNNRRCDFFWKAAKVYETLSDEMRLCLHNTSVGAGVIHLHWQQERMRRAREKLCLQQPVPMPSRYPTASDSDECDFLPNI
jgi:hypothetical protein